MKQTFLVGILFCAITIVSAQPSAPKITWGDPVEDLRRGGLDALLGTDASGYYAIMFDRRDRFLAKFDIGLNLVKKLEIPFEEDNVERQYEGAMLYGNSVIVFSSFYNRDELVHSYYWQIADTELSALGKPQVIAEIKHLDIKARRDALREVRRGAGWTVGLEGSDIIVSESPDSSKLMLAFHLPLSGKYEKVKMMVCGQDLAVQWEKDLEMPYEDALYEVERFRVDNEGGVYVAGKLYQERNEARASRKGERPSYKYMIVSFLEEGGNRHEFEIDGGDKFITDLSITVSSSGELLGAGFYSEQNSSNAGGSFFLRMEPKTGALKKASFKPFTFEFLTEGLSDRSISKAKRGVERKGEQPELYKMRLRELVRREDGGVVMVAEQYYVRVVQNTYTDANGVTRTTTSYHYNYNDILVVNIDAAGEVDWQIKVKKRQVTSNDSGLRSSFTLAVVNDQIYLLFNDSNRNLAPDEGNRNRVYNADLSKRGIVSLVRIDSEGTQKRSMLFSNGEEDMYLYPKKCSQLDDSEMVLYGRGRKRGVRRFAKLSLAAS